MIYTREQKQSAYNSLPDEVRVFIDDAETGDLVTKILADSGLSEDDQFSADSEILFSMYGLQSLQEAIVEISKISGKNLAQLSDLKSQLEKNIFSKLPPVKKIRPDWQDRIEELSRKYGLDQVKTESLILICSEIISDPSKKGVVLSNLANALGISNIVAEQISEELDGRVFTVTPKFTPITKTEGPRPISTPQIQEIPPEQTFLTPEPTNPEKEYTPPNLPVAEEDRELIKEKVSIPRYVPTSVEEIRAKENERYEALKNDTAIKMQAEELVGGANVANEPSKIIYKPKNSPLVSPEEVVQRTTQVPRFNLASETAPESAQSTSFVDQKLSGFVVPKEEEKPSAPESPIVKSYSVDPYREPVE